MKDHFRIRKFAPVPLTDYIVLSANLKTFPFRMFCRWKALGGLYCRQSPLPPQFLDQLNTDRGLLLFFSEKGSVNPDFGIGNVLAFSFKKYYA